MAVDAPQKLDIPVRKVTPEIPRTIELRVGVRPEWVCNETLGVELGAIEIALRDTLSPDIQLPYRADGYWVRERVQDVKLLVGQGAPVRDALPLRANFGLGEQWNDKSS